MKSSHSNQSTLPSRTRGAKQQPPSEWMTFGKAIRRSRVPSQRKAHKAEKSTKGQGRALGQLRRPTHLFRALPYRKAPLCKGRSLIDPHRLKSCHWRNSKCASNPIPSLLVLLRKTWLWTPAFCTHLRHGPRDCILGGRGLLKVELVLLPHHWNQDS